MTISKQLHEALIEEKNSGKPLRQIAEETGVDKGTLSRFIRNPDLQITADTIDLLAEHYQICSS